VKQGENFRKKEQRSAPLFVSMVTALSNLPKNVQKNAHFRENPKEKKKLPKNGPRIYPLRHWEGGEEKN